MPSSERQDDPMFAMLRASAKVRDGHWIEGARTHVLAEFLTALEADGWSLVRTNLREREALDDFILEPIVGHCSKCGEVRSDFYTCRDGGETVPLPDGAA